RPRAWSAALTVARNTPLRRDHAFNTIPAAVERAQQHERGGRSLLDQRLRRTARRPVRQRQVVADRSPVHEGSHDKAGGIDVEQRGRRAEVTDVLDALALPQLPDAVLHAHTAPRRNADVGPEGRLAVATQHVAAADGAIEQS